MRRIIEKAQEMLKDPSRSFRDRVFVLLTLITVFVASLALIGDILLGENIVEIITIIAAVIVVTIITFISIKKNQVQLAVRLIVIGLMIFMLPILFFFGGGVEGGGVLWIIFAYLYTGLVLSGKWKVGMLFLLTAESCLFYWAGFNWHDLISQHSRKNFYMDSLISVIIVGNVCCFMVWFVEWLFREENKRAREETKKVEELNKSRSRFFSSMSHEIRTPINSILGLNEIILRQEDASEEIIRDANNIQGAGRMLLALVNDILDMSKIEAGKMDIIPVNYNLGSMISEIVNMVWLRAEQKGLELKVEIDPTLPSELYGDEVRIKQILINLLNNAVKYTAEGSVTLHIEKEDMDEDKILIMFSVIDTGMGIKQDSIPYLFDAFQRVDEERNSKIEGTGLGLAIVKQLVTLMDGKITVNSVYTQGSTFMVALWQKVTRADAIGSVKISNSGYRKTEGKYMPGFTAPDASVLIVDDDNMNLEVEKKLIADTNMRIDTAKSGIEALSMTIKKRYDIILMDHLMPEMDGIECLQNIRKQSGGLNNHAPIIVLTANAGSENVDLYSRSGFDGYLVKPVSGQQLEDMLLMHIPSIKIMKTGGNDINKAQMNTSRGYTKKIPVIVATSSMCDLPARVLDDCRIDIIPFSIITDGKTYYDRIEAGTDEMIRYGKAGAVFDSAPPSVEDFERFFGMEMKKAHNIIYITIASGVSAEYSNACTAARAYENVKVYNTGVNSCATGMMVLLAYRMTIQGMSWEKIIEELDYIKEKISCSFITNDAEFMMSRGIIGKGIYGFMNAFSLRPYIVLRESRLFVKHLFMGEKVNSYKKYIKRVLNKRIDPDVDVVFVEYNILTPEEMDEIRQAIRKCYDFKHIYFQKVSPVMTLNCGNGALGLSFLMKDDKPYNLGIILSSDYEYDKLSGKASVADSDDDQDTEDLHIMAIGKAEFIEAELGGASNKASNKADVITVEENESFEEKQVEQHWYDKIEGIDPEKALTNSGSEETFKSVLKIFYDSADQRISEISDFYGSEDWENYTIKVHALKSSARMIGADALSDEAMKLEDAGKAGNIDYIKEKNDGVIAALREFVGRLAPVFEEGADAEDDTDGSNEGAGNRGAGEDTAGGSGAGDDGTKDKRQAAPAVVPDRFMIDMAYDTIKNSLESGNYKMIGMTLQEIADYPMPDEDKAKLDKIKELAEAEDYEGIKGMM